MRFAAAAAAALLVTSPAFAGLFDGDDCRHTAPRNAVTSAAGITRVVIRVGAGSLDVNGVSGAREIAANGTACSSEADFLSRINVSMRKSGSELHIESHIPSRTVVFGSFSARLNLEVTIPAGLPVEIEDRSGSIRVANTGALTIDDNSGSIDVRDVNGPLTIRDDSGSITVDGVRGDVMVEDDSGGITVRNVTGNVEVEDDSGSISIAEIGGSVLIRDDDSGSITIRDVRRDVTIDRDGSGSINVTDVGGNFTVGRKGSGSINHDRVRGQVSIPARR